MAPRPDEDEPGRTVTDAPDAPPRPPADAASELRFVTGDAKRQRRRLAAGEPAIVTVAVQAPGEVEIPGLGLLHSAEPGTPARFDVLVNRPGRYEITFQPVEGRPQRIGVIEVEAA